MKCLKCEQNAQHITPYAEPLCTLHATCRACHAVNTWQLHPISRRVACPCVVRLDCKGKQAKQGKMVFAMGAWYTLAESRGEKE